MNYPEEPGGKELIQSSTDNWIKRERMKTLKCKVENVEYYIECNDDISTEVVENAIARSGKRRTKTTSSLDKSLSLTDDFFRRVGKIAVSMADQISDELKGMQAPPSRWELECAMTTSLSGDICILTGKADSGIKLRMSWHGDK